MSAVELFTVEGCFEIASLGVVLRPDLPVPNGRWKARSDTVTVVRPDGKQSETTAEFKLWHLNMADLTVSIDRRWRVVLSLPGRTRDELPLGTKILVSQEIRDALYPKNTG
jgi:hypothetical protein